MHPLRIYLFSGKRKSGKDYITGKLINRLGPQACIIRISGPIKAHWAKEKGLELDSLLDDSPYKESHRKEMVEWSEAVRRKDYGYFCKAAVDMYSASGKLIWIVSDGRRKTDIRWFKENYGEKVRTVRIQCDDETRRARGWIYSPGIDDAETECDLDDYDAWDYTIENNTLKNIDDIPCCTEIIEFYRQSCT